MKHRRYLEICVILFVLINCYSTIYAQKIWRKVYAYQYELSFYEQKASSYDNAKQICKDNSATIVQLDIEYVRKAVYFTIGSSARKWFWIGATRSSSDANEWKWDSGSTVDSSFAWENDITDLNQNNSVILKSNNKLAVALSTFEYAGIICQVHRGLSYPWKVDTAGYHVTIYNGKVNNWDEAVLKCNSINAALVQLDDADVKELVYGIINRVQGVNHFWIGITRTCKTCNNWVWLDGTAASSLDWKNGEPNNAGRGEDKAVIKKTINKLYDTSTTYGDAAVICQAKRIFCSTTPSVCENGGTCSEDTTGISSCKCTAGYYGATCSEEYCKTHANPCQNNGDCSSTTNDPFYRCTCVSNGYYGTTCTERYCETHTNPCLRGGTCSFSTTSPFYSCNCASGYYGARCGNKYCQFHTNPCENGGTCSSTFVDPFYSCICAPGFYSLTCQKKYCLHHNNPCENDGQCISNTQKEPFYTCDCSGTGYSGFTCNGALVELSSIPTTIGIVGGYVNIDVKITTYVGILTVKMYKEDTIKPLIQEKSNVGNQTATFTLFINGTSDKGNYVFKATPMGDPYKISITTRLEVHVNATIKSVSPSFIFSPVTNGSTKVNCAAAGIPAPDVTWFYHSNEVATTKNRVYQNKNSNEAILHVETAALSDKGKYTCVAKNKVGNQKLEKISTEFIELAVYGSPNIKSIDALPCSKKGRLTVNWEPNNQTTSILHRFVAKSINSSVDQVFAEEKGGENVVFDNLDPYTQYEITVVVCPDMCLSQLTDSRIQITGHGLPGAVTNGNVHENEDSCFVLWSQPNSPVDQIIGYEVSVADTWIYQPSDMNLPFTSINSDNVNQTLNYTLSTKFNRNYSFNVTAITCAGKGESVVATGRCKTRRSVPSVVPPATLSDASSISGPIREITVYLPSETNGPVSCMFVIVNKGNSSVLNGSFGITQLQEAAEAALLNNNTGVDYLSVAISRDDVVGGKFVTNLGNGNSTSCDITNLFTGNKLKKRSIGATNATYTGKNKPLLTKGTVYGFFIATTTPVEDGPPLFQIGEFQSFINGKVESES